MKPTERDEILILIKKFFDDGGLISRLDERTLNYGKDLSDINIHLGKLNNTMLKHAVQISTNKGSIRWIRMLLVAVGLLVIGIIGGGITGMLGWLG